jgi:N-acyl-D-aspartate/D-glutamate deacylase
MQKIQREALIMDILIKNATIVDGSGKPSFQGDLVVGGQCGISAAPIDDRYREDVKGTVGMLVPPKASMPWEAFSTFASYLEFTEKHPPAVNVAPLVGQGMIRAAVLGYSGEGHWFFEPDRLQAYNKAAAGLAWERTLDFLERSSI